MTARKTTAAGVDRPLRPPRCTVAGCEVKVYERGLCLVHFGELRDRGELPPDETASGSGR